MKKTLTLALMILVTLGAFSQDKKVNHILIIDKTASMAGQGDGSNHGNIWPQVQTALRDYCKNLRTGEQLTVYAFDSGIYGPEVFVISDPETDIPKAQQYLGSIEPNGMNTALKNALLTVLNNWDTAHYNNWMFVFTDGNDNISHNISFDQIADLFRLKRGDLDFSYLVTLGTNVTELPTREIQVVENARPSELHKIMSDKLKIEQERRSADSLRTVQDEQARKEAEARRLEEEKAKEKAEAERLAMEKQRYCDSIKANCVKNNGRYKVDRSGDCICKPPVPLWVKTLMGLLVLLILIIGWILFGKKILFPVFDRGELQIAGYSEAQKFAGFRRIYLGRQAKVSNNIFKTMFIGKDGHLLRNYDFAGEVSLEKYKGKLWGILKLTSPETSISQQGRMYNYNPDTNDGIYTVMKEGGEIVTFYYMNVQNQKQL